MDNIATYALMLIARKLGRSVLRSLYGCSQRHYGCIKLKVRNSGCWLIFCECYSKKTLGYEISMLRYRGKLILHARRAIGKA